LDTLNELAAALGDDPAFFTTVATNLSTHASATHDVHGVAGDVVGTTDYQTIRNKVIGPFTSLGSNLDANNYTVTGLAAPASSTDAATKGYVDTAVSAVIDGSPALLDTLNELSAAINDDANFATTITNSIGTKVSKSGDTMTGALTLPSAPVNPLHAATKGYVDDEIIVHNRTTDVHGISNAANLAYQVDVSNAITVHNSQISNVHGISDTGNLAYLTSPTFTGTVVLPADTTIGTISPVELAILDGITSSTAELNVLTGITATTAQLNTLTGITASTAELNLLDGVTATTAEINTLTGITATTTELNILHGMTSSTAELNILTGVTATSAQINVLTGITASTAELNILTGATVSTAELNTLDGVTVLASEINQLSGVTSAIQSQIDSKAPIANPTFTGIVSGITKAMVGLGDVDNTSDASKPISTATQSALDLKADLAGPTFTGTVTLPSTTSIGTVSATEVGYLDGVTSAIQTQLDGKADLSGDTFTGNVAISATTPSTSTTTGALVIAGGLGTGDSAYIGGNLVISGDFTVNGTTTTVNATDLAITDPLIYIGEGNNANSSDLGMVASFNDGTYQHAGLVRDSSDAKWKLFKGVTDEPTTTINFTQGSLDALAVGAFEASSAVIGNVSNTELQYLDGVTSGIQSQLDAKLGTSTAASTYAPIAAPTFTGLVTVSSSGVAFSDGTQTKVGVPSITTISQKTASYTLASLDERDTIVEIGSASATTLTIPTDATINYPVGTTLDIIQTGAGQVTIAGAGGVTVNATPGLKLRTQWSSATLLKRAANTWLVYGDLSA
jgi:hypothetical protein